MENHGPPHILQVNEYHDELNNVYSMHIFNFTMKSKLVVVNNSTYIDVLTAVNKYNVPNELLVLKAETEYFHTWFDVLSATFSEVLCIFSPVDERKTRLRL